MPLMNDICRHFSNFFEFHMFPAVFFKMLSKVLKWTMHTSFKTIKHIFRWAEPMKKLQSKWRQMSFIKSPDDFVYMDMFFFGCQWTPRSPSLQKIAYTKNRLNLQNLEFRSKMVIMVKRYWTVNIGAIFEPNSHWM